MTQQEFGHIAREHSGKLKALARRFCRASDMAVSEDDVVQEALMAFWNLSERGYPVRNAEAVLVKITKNICISYYRKRHIATEPIVSDSYTGGASASEGIELQDASRLRDELYGVLTPAEREFMHIREETGWSLDEMAARTGKGKNVIKALLSKARRKMKEILKDQ